MFDWKVRLVGAFRRSNFKILNSFQNAGKNNIKIKEKQEFLRKIGFTQNFGFWCNSKNK